MDIKKIFVFLMMGIFMISMASAVLETKSFNPNALNHGEIQINDWLFMNKADYRLMDYGASVVDVWAEGEYKLYKKTHLFTGVFYKDIAGKRGDLRDVEFFIWEEKFETKYDPVYENQNCYLDYSNATNTTEICDKVLISNESHQEDQSGWISYEKNMDLEESEGRWRMEAKRKANKPIDFILEAHGKTFDEWAWWDNNWDFKKEITVTENSGGSLTNYSTLIYVAYDSDMQTDFDDLRFLDSTETVEFDYWIENKTDSNFVWVWVEVASLTASTNTSVFMYYGNSGASSNSNIKTAFLVGDDFNDASLDTSLWNTQETPTESGGYLRMSGTSAYEGISSKTTFAKPLIMETKTRVSSTSDYSKGTIYAESDDFTGNHEGYTYEGGTGKTRVQVNNLWSGDIIKTTSINTWEEFETIRYSNNTILSQTGVNTGYDTQTGSDNSAYVEFSNWQGNAGYMDLDIVYLREWISSEPTYSIGAEQTSNILTIIQNSPVDYYNSSLNNVTFNCSGTDETGLYSINLTINGSVYGTVTGAGSTNLSLASTETLADEFYEWYCTGNDDTDTKNSSIRYLTVDATAPTITSAYNLTDLTPFNLPINSTWHYNATDEHLDSCYYNSTANATQTIITCNSTINTTWTAGGNKTITFCANDTFGSESCNTEYIWIYHIQTDQADSPDPIAESFDATFYFMVNLTGIPTTTATLVLNNTIYAPTTTVALADSYYFEVIATIPDGWGNTTGIAQDWFWNYTIDGVATDELTDTENITVYELAIDDCSSYGEMIFNFSVLDEATLISANESLTIDVEASLTLTSKADATQYISYAKAWEEDNNPQICVPTGVINNSQFWIDLTVGYSSTDHVWEFFYIDSGTLNSTKIYEGFNGLTQQDINLIDLLTTDSTSFLFNYFDIDGLAVDGAVVHVMRKYIGSGEFLEVERAKQDQNGDTIVHLVEEDVIYYFLITKDGQLLYTSSTYTALCQATPCTIQIEASGGSATFPTDWDLVDGGAYEISTNSATREVTLNYTFNESDTVNLTVYKYNSDGSYSVIDTNSTTGSVGSLVLGVPLVAGNVSFFASMTKGGEFKDSEWVDLEQKSRDSIGITLGLLLSALIILSLGLMTISEGAGVIFYVVLGVFVSGALGLMATELSTGVSVTVYLIIAGGLLLWKFTRRRA